MWRVKTKVILPFGLSVAYVAAYPLLGSTLGDAGTILLSLPVLLAGWFFGARVGIAAAIFAFPLNVVLQGLYSDQTVIEWIRSRGGLGHATLLGTVALVGWLQDMKTRRELEISRRAEVERSLRQSEHRYRIVAENAGDVVLLLGLNGELLDVSSRGCITLGYGREEMLGMSLKTIEPDFAEESVSTWWGEIEKGVRVLHTGEFRRKDGTTIPVEVRISGFRTSEGPRLVAVARDMTEHNRIDQSLREASRLASVGRLAAGAAHQLNNPLNHIVGYAQLLMAEEIPTQFKRDLEKIYSEGLRAAKIVEGLLSFTRNREPAKKHVDVTAVVDRALALKSRDFELNQIQLNVQLPRESPKLLADENMLLDALLNILTNSEQAIVDAGGSGQITVTGDVRDDRYRINIHDNGPGIMPEHLDHIFEPFFTTREAEGGTGLGLSISHGIIRQHDGELRAQSSPSQGTSLHISLPISSSPAIHPTPVTECGTTTQIVRREISETMESQ